MDPVRYEPLLPLVVPVTMRWPQSVCVLVVPEAEDVQVLRLL